MARKRKSSLSSGRIALFVALILLLLAAIWAWRQYARTQPAVPPTIDKALPLPPQNAGGSVRSDSNAGTIAAKVSGKLSVRRPPRDARLGIVADAAILFRIVEMYQWVERCEGANCRYEKAWSGPRIDSARFRVPAGHENPTAPFADARFVAGEIRLGDLLLDPRLLDAQATVDFPVKADALPPNLAATFSVADGALYAGGDAAHPQIGAVRVRYRVVPAGEEIEVSGVRRGDRLEAN